MTLRDFYIDFGYNDLVDLQKKDKRIDLKEFESFGIDKIHYSGGYPALFFKEVNNFENETLKEIARIHHLIWNYRKVMFLVVVSPVEVRIYDCCKHPFNYLSGHSKIDAELKERELINAQLSDKDNLAIIREVFSQVAVDCGVIWTTENPIRDKIAIQQRIDRFLVKSLLEVARKLRLMELNDDVIHCLLMRSLFIMYLEDKGAASETKLYSQILDGAKSFLDILANKQSSYLLFAKLQEHFNGNVFPILPGEQKKVQNKHLDLIRKCLIDGDLGDDLKLFNDWRIFRFDIIQIELLSEIYENFLAEFKGSKKEEAGQYYTPPSLVQFILNDRLKIAGEKNYNVKILDPACGSGIFLVESFKRLVVRWKNDNPNQNIEFKDLRDILKANIFGIEYDKFAIRVTAFSLYLAIVEHLNPKTLWVDKRYKFPHLINDPTDSSLIVQGQNLIRADTLTVPYDIFGKIDLVVGNPPFGAKVKLKTIRDFCKDKNFGLDMVIPFLYKATKFAAEGSVALIFNTKVLTNAEGPFQNFRKWLFNETYVEKIYNLSIFRKAPKAFGGQLFPSAIGPVSILYYQNSQPEQPVDYVEYWAPKTYVKNNIVEGVLVDQSDIKFLPREECKGPRTNIWKIAIWGSLEDFKLVKRLEEYPSLKDTVKNKKLNIGSGLQFLNESTTKPFEDNEIPKYSYIKPECIQRYHTPDFLFGKLASDLTESSLKKYQKYYELSRDTQPKKINVFRRLGKKEAYLAPHVLVKEGLSNKRICASFLKNNSSFNSKVWGISGGDQDVLKTITALINSSISTYYLFLTSASLGIEREEIKKHEVLKLPYNFEKEDIKKISSLVDSIEKRIISHQPLDVDTSDIEAKMDDVIFKCLGINDDEKILIQDYLRFQIPLLFEGYKSSSLKPCTPDESRNYSETIKQQLHNFLDEPSVKIYASRYSLSKYTPLNMIKLSFGDTSIEEKEIFQDKEFELYLNEINQYSISKLSPSIYIQKQIKFFTDQSVYIIKPNQKRFWCRSAAINDSREIIMDVLRLSQGVKIS